MGKLLAAALCLLLLCACSPISLNTEDLLAPPRLNERQAKLEETLSAAVNPGLILYKYPMRGESRSPFVFYDLDRDGRQELSIVFYAYRSDSENVRAKIMREGDDGSWVILNDISGQGNQIDFVQFAHVLDKDSECMLIGWHNSARGVSSLSVYSFKDLAISREINVPYLSLGVDGYLGDDGLNQIALIRQDSSGTHRLTLLGKTLDGRIDSIGETPLSQSVASILQILRGRLWDGSYGIFIDERLDGAYTATEVAQASQGKLTLLVGDEYPERYERTFRLERTLSQDLLGDGMVDIPTLTALPGYVSGIEIEPPPLTEYIRLNADGGFDTVHRAVINNDAGYLVFLPDRWLGTVTVLRRPESGEWQFYKIDPLTNMPSAELLRVRVYSTRDYKDRFTSDYILLAEKGLFQYEAYIPAAAGEPLAITQAELERLFMLI